MLSEGADTLDSEIPFLRTTAKRETDERRARAALSRRFVGLLMAVAVVALMVNLLTLATYPAVHTDEAWYANLAWNWIRTGNRWTTLDVGASLNGQGQGTTALGALPTRLAIQVWGLSLQAIRIPGLLAGLALLGAIAGLGSFLRSSRSGLLAALMLLTQPLFLLGSHLARPEIWLALVTSLALGCSLLGWRHDQPAWDVAAALLTVLSMEIHQNGAVFAVGLAATYLARYGRAALKQRGSLAFAGTGLVGATAYVFWHAGWFLPGQGNGNADVLGAGASHSIPLLSSHPLKWLVNEFVRYLLYFGNEPLAALLLGLGIVAALRRRDDTDRVLLAWLAGSALAMMLLVSHMLETYLLPMVTVGCLLVGRGMDELLAGDGARGRQAIALTFGVLLLPMLLTLGRSGMGRATQLQRELQAAVPCTRILGPNQYWLAFAGCDFRSWDVISHYHHRQNASFEESMAAVRPDYLLIDNTIVAKLRDDFGVGGQTGNYYALPRDDFQRFLNERTALVRWLVTPGGDTVQVREVHWGGGP